VGHIWTNTGDDCVGIENCGCHHEHQSSRTRHNRQMDCALGVAANDISTVALVVRVFRILYSNTRGYSCSSSAGTTTKAGEEHFRVCRSNTPRTAPLCIVGLVDGKARSFARFSHDLNRTVSSFYAATTTSSCELCSSAMALRGTCANNASCGALFILE